MTIFTFYKQKNNNECIHIISSSFLEAIEVLYEINNYSSIIYNLQEYKKEEINDINIILKVLEIDDTYLGVPYILSKSQYQQIINLSESKKSNKKIVIDQSTIENSEIKDKLIQKIEKIINHPEFNTFLSCLK